MSPKPPWPPWNLSNLLGLLKVCCRMVGHNLSLWLEWLDQGMTLTLFSLVTIRKGLPWLLSMNTIMIIIYPRNPGFYHVSTILLDLFIFVINLGVLSAWDWWCWQVPRNRGHRHLSSRRSSGGRRFHYFWSNFFWSVFNIRWISPIFKSSILFSLLTQWFVAGYGDNWRWLEMEIWSSRCFIIRSIDFRWRFLVKGMASILAATARKTSSQARESHDSVHDTCIDII